MRRWIHNVVWFSAARRTKHAVHTKSHYPPSDLISVAQLEFGANALRARCEGNALLEARILLAHAMQQTTGHSDQYLTRRDTTLSQSTVEYYHRLLNRRRSGEPLSYITEMKEFWSLSFWIPPGVLIPRWNTELLVSVAISCYPPERRATHNFSILDLGTGSGCLLIALLKEFPRSRGLGIDISERALSVARANGERHGVSSRATFVQSDWLAEISPEKHGLFDIIVGNPPYIPSDRLSALPPTVGKFEPQTALDGGAHKGAEHYIRIADQVDTFLGRDGGVMALEFGGEFEGQRDAIVRSFTAPRPPATKRPLRFVETKEDLEGTERCLVFRWEKNA